MKWINQNLVVFLFFLTLCSLSSSGCDLNDPQQGKAKSQQADPQKKPVAQEQKETITPPPVTELILSIQLEYASGDKAWKRTDLISSIKLNHQELLPADQSNEHASMNEALREMVNNQVMKRYQEQIASTPESKLVFQLDSSLTHADLIALLKPLKGKLDQVFIRTSTESDTQPFVYEMTERPKQVVIKFDPNKKLDLPTEPNITRKVYRSTQQASPPKKAEASAPEPKERRLVRKDFQCEIMIPSPGSNFLLARGIGFHSPKSLIENVHTEHESHPEGTLRSTTPMNIKAAEDTTMKQLLPILMSLQKAGFLDIRLNGVHEAW